MRQFNHIPPGSSSKRGDEKFKVKTKNKGKQRHPSIGDYVTAYVWDSSLGPDAMRKIEGPVTKVCPPRPTKGNRASYDFLFNEQNVGFNAHVSMYAENHGRRYWVKDRILSEDAESHAILKKAIQFNPPVQPD